MREALLMHEEALRVNRMCPELRKKVKLKNVLKNYHERSLNLYQDLEDEDDFRVSSFEIKSLLMYLSSRKYQSHPQ